MVGPCRTVQTRRLRRGFPTDLPMVGRQTLAARHDPRRGFPTDLPMVGRCGRNKDRAWRRGFPTDLPMVGLLAIW